MQAEQRPLVEEARFSGSVVSPHVAKLSTQVSGMVSALSVKLGDRVEAGAEILRLDSELAGIDLAEAKAATEKAVQELADAKRRLADAKQLSKRQAVPANRLKALETEILTDSADLKRMRAQQQHLQARLRRYRITAPFAGVISRKHTEVGEWLAPGDTVVELTAVDGLRIDFQVPQRVAAKVKTGSAIQIQFDALPGQTFDGDIDWVLPVVDAETRTFLLRAALKDTKAPLVTGMSASAILRLDKASEGVTIPRDALIRHPDGRVTVWIAKRQSKTASVSERRVRTGLQFDGMVTIADGLTPGEWIVVQGNESLREGMKVTVKESP